MPDANSPTASWAAFVEGLAPCHAEQAVAWPQGPEALDRAIESARQRWPAVELPHEDFARHMARGLDESADLQTALANTCCADLYLALGAARGNAAAISAIDRDHAQAMRSAIARIKGAESPEDLLAVARSHLFVGDGTSGPAIARFAGRGSLSAWLRVTTFNRVSKEVRGRWLPADDEGLDGLAATADPEFDLLKVGYHSEFKQSFAQAVDALSSRQRTLLKQSVVNRIPVRRIGKMYGVHHATAARWIAEARELLVRETKLGLARRLGIDDEELPAIAALVRSRLDLSLSRVFGSAST